LAEQSHKEVTMSKHNIPLYNIKVAAPCPADWNGMIGDDRVRFCAQCNLNVYNLSEMSVKEAENLIQSREGRLCVRYYQRQDGTILTDNCPVGLRAIKRRAKRIASAAISAVLSFAAGLGLSSSIEDKPFSGFQGEMVRTDSVMGGIGVAPKKDPVPETTGNDLVMGQIAIQVTPIPPQGHTRRHKKR
jgi:hypothetical protein